MPKIKLTNRTALLGCALLSILLHGVLLSMGWSKRLPTVQTAAPNKIVVQLLPNPKPAQPVQPIQPAKPQSGSGKTKPTLKGTAPQTQKPSLTHSVAINKPSPASAVAQQENHQPEQGEPALNLKIDLQALKPKTMLRRNDSQDSPEPTVGPSQLAKDLEKGFRPDCRRAYSNMGLLAAPILLKDAILDSGCQW